MTFRDWLGLTVTAVWLSAMLAHSSAAEPTAAGPTRWTSGSHTLAVDGMERTFLLDMPERVRPGAALVLVFHGYTDSAARVRQSAGFTTLMAEHGFVAAYPQGTVDARGKTFFNVGYGCRASEKVDDIRFVRELVTRLVADLGLDREAVFSTGMSNGGDMSYLLAAQPQPLVRAIAPVAGTMMTSWGGEFSPPKPLPVLAVNGRRDDVTKWDGDPDNHDGWGASLSVDDVIERWVKPLGPARADREERPDRSPPRGSAVVVSRWTGTGSHRRSGRRCCSMNCRRGATIGRRILATRGRRRRP
jgi:polyhydroxybutyrate depolymerase